MIYFKRCWVVFGIALLSFSSLSALAQDLNDSEQSLVVFFGDSIAVGFQGRVGNATSSFDPPAGNGLQGFGCPTILMQNLLRNEGQRVGSTGIVCATDVISTPVRDRVESQGLARNSIVVNWGISGSSSSVGVQRIVSNLGQATSQFQSANQRFVLIHYGTNDPGFGISSSGTAFNTRQMIGLARAAGYTPAVSTLLPRFFFDTEPLGNSIRAAGQQEGAPVVDMFSLFLNFPGSPSANFRLRGRAGQQGGASNLLPIETFFIPQPVTSRLHPNNQGYSVMVEGWFEAFLEDAIDPFREDIVITPIINLLLDDE